MRRGFSLAYVLTLAALAFLLVGLAINSSLQLYRREQQQRHREQAILYSKNGLERAVARLAENPEWGKQPTDGLVVPALAGHPADACARVTFDPSSPDASVNQLDRDGTAEVPKNTVHLWSVGSYGGVKVRTEAFVAKPQFPFAIASSGPLRTSGSFFTGTVDDPAKADLALESPEFQQSLKQASLLSNGDSVSLLGSPVHITGDVVCHGSVERGAGVLVDGEVRSHASAKQIPHFDMASFDTAGKPLLDEIPPGDLSRSSALKGYARCAGDLNVGGSGLKLEEAILYVDGNLHVRGPLSGKGAVFVTGTVTLESTALGALDQLALIAGGDLTITGRAGQRSKLVGLLGSKGNLRLSDLTVVGAVVCAGSADRVLEMSNVNVLGNSAGLDFGFELGWGRAKTTFTVDLSAVDGGGKAKVVLTQIPDGRGGKRNPLPADFYSRYSPSFPRASLLNKDDFSVITSDGAVKPLGETQVSIDTGQVGDELSALQEALTRLAAEAQSQQQSQGTFSLNLNKFLRVGDELQTVYRKVL